MQITCTPHADPMPAPMQTPILTDDPAPVSGQVIRYYIQTGTRYDEWAMLPSGAKIWISALDDPTDAQPAQP